MDPEEKPFSHVNQKNLLSNLSNHIDDEKFHKKEKQNILLTFICKLDGKLDSIKNERNQDVCEKYQKILLSLKDRIFKIPLGTLRECEDQLRKLEDRINRERRMSLTASNPTIDLTDEDKSSTGCTFLNQRKISVSISSIRTPSDSHPRTVNDVTLSDSVRSQEDLGQTKSETMHSASCRDERSVRTRLIEVVNLDEMCESMKQSAKSSFQENVAAAGTTEKRYETVEVCRSSFTDLSQITCSDVNILKEALSYANSTPRRISETESLVQLQWEDEKRSLFNLSDEQASNSIVISPKRKSLAADMRLSDALESMMNSDDSSVSDDGMNSKNVMVPTTRSNNFCSELIEGNTAQDQTKENSYQFHEDLETPLKPYSSLKSNDQNRSSQKPIASNLRIITPVERSNASFTESKGGIRNKLAQEIMQVHKAGDSSKIQGSLKTLKTNVPTPNFKLLKSPNSGTNEAATGSLACQNIANNPRQFSNNNNNTPSITPRDPRLLPRNFPSTLNCFGNNENRCLSSVRKNSNEEFMPPLCDNSSFKSNHDMNWKNATPSNDRSFYNPTFKKRVGKSSLVPNNSQKGERSRRFNFHSKVNKYSVDRRPRAKNFEETQSNPCVETSNLCQRAKENNEFFSPLLNIYPESDSRKTRKELNYPKFQATSFKIPKLGKNDNLKKNYHVDDNANIDSSNVIQSQSEKEIHENCNIDSDCPILPQNTGKHQRKRKRFQSIISDEEDAEEVPLAAASNLNLSESSNSLRIQDNIGETEDFHQKDLSKTNVKNDESAQKSTVSGPKKAKRVISVEADSSTHEGSKLIQNSISGAIVSSLQSEVGSSTVLTDDNVNKICFTVPEKSSNMTGNSSARSLVTLPETSDGITKRKSRCSSDLCPTAKKVRNESNPNEMRNSSDFFTTLDDCPVKVNNAVMTNDSCGKLSEKNTIKPNAEDKSSVKNDRSQISLTDEKLSRLKSIPFVRQIIDEIKVDDSELYGTLLLKINPAQLKVVQEVLKSDSSNSHHEDDKGLLNDASKKAKSDSKLVENCPESDLKKTGNQLSNFESSDAVPKNSSVEKISKSRPRCRTNELDRLHADIKQMKPTKNNIFTVSGTRSCRKQAPMYTDRYEKIKSMVKKSKANEKTYSDDELSSASEENYVISSISARSTRRRNERDHSLSSGRTALFSSGEEECQLSVQLERICEATNENHSYSSSSEKQNKHASGEPANASTLVGEFVHDSPRRNLKHSKKKISNSSNKQKPCPKSVKLKRYGSEAIANDTPPVPSSSISICLPKLDEQFINKYTKCDNLHIKKNEVTSSLTEKKQDCSSLKNTENSVSYVIIEEPNIDSLNKIGGNYKIEDSSSGRTEDSDQIIDKNFPLTQKIKLKKVTHAPSIKKCGKRHRKHKSNTITKGKLFSNDTKAKKDVDARIATLPKRNSFKAEDSVIRLQKIFVEKHDGKLSYNCNIDHCFHDSYDPTMFANHLNLLHKEVKWDGHCELCNKKNLNSEWIDAFVHLMTEHLTFIDPTDVSVSVETISVEESVEINRKEQLHESGSKEEAVGDILKEDVVNISKKLPVKKTVEEYAVQIIPTAYSSECVLKKPISENNSEGEPVKRNFPPEHITIITNVESLQSIRKESVENAPAEEYVEKIREEILENVADKEENANNLEVMNKMKTFSEIDLIKLPSKPRIRVRRFSGDKLSGSITLSESDVRTDESPSIMIQTSEQENHKDGFIVIMNVETVQPEQKTESESNCQILNKMGSVEDSSSASVVSDQSIREIRLMDFYKCGGQNQCTFSTNSSSEFRNHFMVMHKNKKKRNRKLDLAFLKCVYCPSGTTFDTPELLIQHVFNEHRYCLYQCPKCDYRACRPIYILWHLRIRHSEDENQILVASLEDNHEAVSSNNFAEKIAEVVPSFYCAHGCTYFTLSIFEFVEHMKQNHEKVPVLNCHLCKHVCFKLDSLLKHYNLHNFAEFQCAYCLCGLSNVDAMKTHLTNNHPSLYPVSVKRACQTQEKGPVEYLDFDESVASLKMYFKLVDRDALVQFVNKAASSSSSNTQKPTNNESLISESNDNALNLDVSSETLPNAVADSTHNSQNATVKAQSTTVIGLSGKDLYRCGMNDCSVAVDDYHSFKEHTFTCDCARNTKWPTCPHCGRSFQTNIKFFDHISLHGVPRYICSLCNFKHTTPKKVGDHMKSHKVFKTKTVPGDISKNNGNNEVYFILPDLDKKARGPQKAIKSPTSKPPQSSQTATVQRVTTVYSSEDIDKCLSTPLFAEPVKCGHCDYSSKVRNNISLHLKSHVSGLATDKDIVNPVPQMEKTELMFNKMTNHAAYSTNKNDEKRNSVFTKIENVGSNEPGKKVPIIPEFVPKTYRFSCGALGCSYITHDSVGLRTHFQTLHQEMNGFRCPHCGIIFSTTKIEQHFRYHNSKLFQCGYCLHVHYQSAGIEKHQREMHPEKKAWIQKIRELDVNEVERLENEARLNVFKRGESKIASTDLWRCNLCRSSQFPQEYSIKEHCRVNHGVGNKYKCPMCDFSTDEEATVSSHLLCSHELMPNLIVHVYKKANEEQSSVSKVLTRQSPSPSSPRAASSFQNSNGGLKSSSQVPAPTVPTICLDIDDDTINEVTSDRLSPDEQRDNMFVLPYSSTTYKCPICLTFSTTSEKIMRDHIFSEKNYIRYVCEACGKYGSSRQEVQPHLEGERATHPRRNYNYILELTMDEEFEKRVQQALTYQSNKMKQMPQEIAKKDEIDHPVWVISDDDDDDDANNDKKNKNNASSMLRKCLIHSNSGSAKNSASRSKITQNAVSTYHCQTCDKNFSSEDRFIHHNSTAHTTSPKCLKGKKYSLRSILASPWFECRFCGLKSTTEHEHALHTNACHKNAYAHNISISVPSCEFCRSDQHTAAEMQAHRRQKHDRSTCLRCRRLFMGELRLFNHIRTSDALDDVGQRNVECIPVVDEIAANTKILCTYCPFFSKGNTYSSYSIVLDHIRSAHEDLVDPNNQPPVEVQIPKAERRLIMAAEVTRMLIEHRRSKRAVAASTNAEKPAAPPAVISSTNTSTPTAQPTKKRHVAIKSTARRTAVTDSSDSTMSNIPTTVSSTLSSTTPCI